MQFDSRVKIDEIKIEPFSSNIQESLYNRIEKLERMMLERDTYFQEIKQMNSNLETKNRKKYLKTPIKEILSATSLQFLLSPIRSKRFLIKIINSCFLIISLWLSIYLVVINIIEFLMYETTTSISTIIENEPLFPIVSICPLGNLNQYNFTLFRFNKIDLINEWENNLEAFYDTSYYNGKCYRFNSGINMTNHSVSIQKSKRSRYNDGLFLEFNTDANSFLVSIYNQTQNSSTIFNKGFHISTGSRNYLSIKRIYDTKLEYPYNDCLNDVSKFSMNKTVINYMRNKNLEYSRMECIRIFENLRFLKESNCNCSLINFDDYPYKVCYNSTEQKNCYDNFIDNFNKKYLNEIFSEHCPLECDTFSYDISINSRTSQTFLEKDSVGIYVYYEDLKYTLISQQPKMQFIDLISNIGGSLGLFVGISFISFLELFEILIEIIFVHFEK